MKKIVVDMQNFLFADSIATAFKNSDYDIAVVRAESPRDTIELCRVFKPFVLLMEVTAYCAAIPVGLFFVVIMICDIAKDNRKKKSENEIISKE